MARVVAANGAVDMMSTDEEKEKNRKERRLQDLQGVDTQVQCAANIAKEIVVNDVQQQPAQKFNV